MSDAIIAEGLGKEYRIYDNLFARIREGLSFGKKICHTPYRALEDVNFRLPHGRALGIIGENGAGKSTLLKVLAGTSQATAGRFTIDGSVASLLELGTGFHSDFTGRMNIYLAAQVLGFTLKEVEEKIDSIIEFAELGEYIDRPVRTYSSGMVMRLGFSVATAIDPDVLIIDEILAVGDLYFQKKCIDRIFNFRNNGKSILFCSHSLFDVRQICDEVIWIKDGRVEMHGEPQDVTIAYANYERALTNDPDVAMEGKELLEGKDLPAIRKTRVVEVDGDTTREVEGPVPSRTDLAVEVDFLIRNPEYVVHLAVALFRMDNICVASFISIGTDLPGFYELGTHRCTLDLPALPLCDGEYNVVAYLLDDSVVHAYDHRPSEKPLLVVQDVNVPGIVQLEHGFSVDKLEDNGRASAT